MSKEMKLWHGVTGCLLLVGIILTMFQPRVYFNAYDYAEQLTESFYDSELMEYHERYGLTDGGDQVQILSQEAMRGSLAEQFDRMFDTSEVFLNGWWFIERDMSGLIGLNALTMLLYVFPVILLLIFFFSGVFHLKSVLSVICAWIYIILAGIIHIAWNLICPSSLANAYYNLYRTDIKRAMGWDGTSEWVTNVTGGTAFSRDVFGDIILKGLNALFRHAAGSGVFFLIVMLVFLFGWTIVLLTEPPVRQDALSVRPQLMSGQWMQMPGTAGGIVEPQRDIRSVGREMQIADRGYAMKPDGPQYGSGVAGIRGSQSGNRVPLRPGGGIYIGSNTEASDMVIEGSAILSKHCFVQLDPSGRFYRVYNLAGDGYSGYALDPKEQKIIGMKRNIPYQLPKGTLIYIGGTEDVLQLW